MTDASVNVAAVDMGSNSFHLLVGRHENGRLVVVDRLKERVALAEGLDANRVLDEAAQARGLDCLRLFAERIRGIDAGSFRAVATSTLRRARNAQEFIDRAEEILGHSVDVIPGVEEARLVFLGAVSELPGRPARLVVDIGGGSTEIALGQAEAEYTASLHMGCVNFTQGFFGDGKLTEDRFASAAFAARLELEPVARALDGKAWQESVGSSGTARAIEQIIRINGWSEEGIDPRGLEKLQKALVSAGSLDDLKLDGLAEKRRPVIAGGLAILAGVFEALDLKCMSTTEGALREGVAYELIGEDRVIGARRATIARLTERYGLDHAHGERVRATALELLQQVPEWELPAESEELLGAAARLHEVGLAVRYSGYHKHGAYILEHSDLPGFTRDEQEMLATLVLCHRRKLRHEAFDDLSGPLASHGLRLALILRLAVRLNRKRVDGAAPKVEFKVKKKKMRLRFPDGWLDANPLSATDLALEAGRVDRADYTLEVA